MARSQGDSYKTWTNHGLNAYRARLDAKLREMSHWREKWYRHGCGWIHVEERDRLTNPNGYWKWNGWEVEAHEYSIRVFPGESVELLNGKPHVIGWAQVTKVIDNDKEYANRWFKEVAMPLAHDLKTWHPANAETETATVFDYEGRKPMGAITMEWDGDTYSYNLIVDGKSVMRSYRRSECAEWAEKIGAELKDIHTP